MEQSVITIPNDIRFLQAVQAYTKEVARQVGFDGKDIEMILLCLEEAFTNVIEHAFDPGEKDVFQVIIKPLKTGLKITVKDKGLPYNPDLIPEFKIYSDIGEQTESGLGIFLMRHLMDEVSFHNLGREGKEFHLTKYIPAKNITEYHTPEELHPYASHLGEKRQDLDKKIIKIRLMEPSEAVEVSRLFYRVYGYTYSIDEIYYPDRFRKLIEDGKILSVVAVDSKGEIIGHTGIKRDSAEAIIGESGIAATKPDFRGQGIFTQMLNLLNEIATNQGIYGLYGRRVTFHTLSQKTGNTCGYRDCDFNLCALPSDRIYKGIGSPKDRISVVYLYLPLVVHEKATIYPPGHHRAFIEAIYNNLSIEISPSSPDGIGHVNLQEQSSFKIDIFSHLNRADIKVYAYGRDIIDKLTETMKMLFRRKTDVINLFLDLEEPATVILCSEFERLGFFCCQCYASSIFQLHIDTSVS
ncbi:MAG: ATP-binding protein [Syntrophorhabdaceae bacterium]|nr:ATP-binding protein [Syntrophorhabdaceae bacterium]